MVLLPTVDSLCEFVPKYLYIEGTSKNDVYTRQKVIFSLILFFHFIGILIVLIKIYIKDSPYNTHFIALLLASHWWKYRRICPLICKQMWNRRFSHVPLHSGPGRNQSAPKLMFGDLFFINPEEMFGFPGIFAKILLPTFFLMSKL